MTSLQTVAPRRRASSTVAATSARADVGHPVRRAGASCGKDITPPIGPASADPECVGGFSLPGLGLPAGDARIKRARACGIGGHEFVPDELASGLRRCSCVFPLWGARGTREACHFPPLCRTVNTLADDKSITNEDSDAAVRSTWPFAMLAVMACSRRAGEPSHALSAERMWGLQRLGAPAISPDGRLAVVPVTRYDLAENKGLTDLWLVIGGGRFVPPADERRGGGQRSRRSARTASPSPSSRRRGTDEAAQIYVIAVDGGEARRLTSVPTGADAAEMVSGRPAHRLRQPRSGTTSCAGRIRPSACKSAATAKSQSESVGPRSHRVLGPFPGRPGAAPFRIAVRRQRASRSRSRAARVISCPATEVDAFFLRHLPGWARGCAGCERRRAAV